MKNLTNELKALRSLNTTKLSADVAFKTLVKKHLTISEASDIGRVMMDAKGKIEIALNHNFNERENKVGYNYINATKEIYDGHRLIEVRILQRHYMRIKTSKAELQKEYNAALKKYNLR